MITKEKVLEITERNLKKSECNLIHAQNKPNVNEEELNNLKDRQQYWEFVSMMLAAFYGGNQNG